MNPLIEIAKVYKQSEPVFKVELKYGGDELRFVVKDQYLPTDENPGADPILDLLAGEWTENLDKQNRVFRNNVNTERAYYRMMGAIRDFMLIASPLKNPKQSKLYQWLYKQQDMAYNSPSCVGFIALYRYLMREEISRSSAINSDPHVKNAMMILELMREKYDR